MDFKTAATITAKAAAVSAATADRGAMRRPARGRHTCQAKDEVKDKDEG